MTSDRRPIAPGGKTCNYQEGCQESPVATPPHMHRGGEGKVKKGRHATVLLFLLFPFLDFLVNPPPLHSLTLILFLFFFIRVNCKEEKKNEGKSN